MPTIANHKGLAGGRGNMRSCGIFTQGVRSKPCFNVESYSSNSEVSTIIFNYFKVLNSCLDLNISKLIVITALCLFIFCQQTRKPNENLSDWQPKHSDITQVSSFGQVLFVCSKEIWYLITRYKNNNAPIISSQFSRQISEILSLNWFPLGRFIFWRIELITGNIAV